MARILIALAFASLLASTPALACDCVRLDPNGPHFASDLDRIAKFYPIAAEGVIEAQGDYAWRFRPTHEYRGPGKASYAIELIGDCSLEPPTMAKLIGKPVFLLLAGGPDRYEASRCVNLLGGAADAAIRDRVVKSCHPR
ncbi:hypothetical protein [Sphingomonas sp.]|uniref:hypothetical protein n=1 Tax=Sphingomonas sp. TaxID=28214 RepID=UPI00286D3C8C|nr:hypothetical protein [Sphingomonas sp.]